MPGRTHGVGLTLPPCQAHALYLRVPSTSALVLPMRLSKPLAAFDPPFNLQGQTCRVGLTIGLALAPHDDQRADVLLKVADAAVYAGKQRGRHCLRRASLWVALA
jgi:predicted signal transduction protein with EAL and GGDEF domain